MSEDPTEAEIKDLLWQLVPIMVAHSSSKAPESFDLCWRFNLYETAKMLDYYNKTVYGSLGVWYERVEVYAESSFWYWDT